MPFRLHDAQHATNQLAEPSTNHHRRNPWPARLLFSLALCIGVSGCGKSEPTDADPVVKTPNTETNADRAENTPTTTTANSSEPRDDAEAPKVGDVGNQVVASTPRDDADEALDEQLAKLQIPPPWLESVETTWDTSKPWGKGRVEIRRLLGLNREAARKEAIKLTWLYLQKDDIGNGHEYAMYTHLGREPAWSIRAHEEFLAKPLDFTPYHAIVSIASLYSGFGEFERAKAHLDKGMNNLPDPPWKTMRQAELHDAYGDLYVAWGNRDEAKRHYREAIRLYPTATPKYGRHLLPRRASKVQSKLDLLNFGSLRTAKLSDGRYEEKALGYSGDIDLVVTIKSGRIDEIDVDHQEKIDQGACVLIPKRIIDEQSLQVDGISGATITKDALVAGTYRALKKAGLE